MYPCPSCRSHSISFRRKWLSWSSLPAGCAVCGRASAIAIAESSGVLVAGLLVATLGGFAAVWLQTVGPLLVSMAIAAGYYFWRQHTAELVAVSEHEQAVAQRSAWVVLLASVFPAWFS